MQRKYKRALSAILISLPHFAQALPIDFSGSLTYDTTRIANHRFSSQPGTQAQGSQSIEGENTAAFQSYIFKLNPTLIVNDSASIKGEMSTGYARGGFMGDNTTINQMNSSRGASGLTAANSMASTGLNMNQLYIDLYTDTAHFKVGRFAKHFGSGILYNSGSHERDRFFTAFDGIQANLDFGNIAVRPYWARVNSINADQNLQQTRSGAVSELGVTLEYKNTDTDTEMGVLYSRRSGEANQGLVMESTFTPTTSFSTGAYTVQIMDIYFRKAWSNLSLSLELPFLSGDAGRIYTASDELSYRASAVITNLKWKPSNNWTLGLSGGTISGDDGDGGTFGAMYLHPNYSLGNILFNYNSRGVSANNFSIFDASVTNTSFAKLDFKYASAAWDIEFVLLYAKANEVAEAGTNAFHHEETYRFVANETQGSSYGVELDFNLSYKMNPNVELYFLSGILLTGDYFSYNNDTNSKIQTSNPVMTSAGLTVSFN